MMVVGNTKYISESIDFSALIPNRLSCHALWPTKNSLTFEGGRGRGPRLYKKSRRFRSFRPLVHGPRSRLDTRSR